MCIRGRIIIALLIVGLGAAAWSAQAEVDPKVAACFSTRWSSVRYNKSVVLRNSGGASAQEQISERLSISCEVEIRKPKRVLGICVAGTVTEMTDANDRDIRAAVVPSRGFSQRYEGLRYRDRFTGPRQVPRWQKVLRSLVDMPANKNFKPELLSELQPSNMELRLDTQLLGGTPGEIRRVKGYFHALTAESFENVDVPFEPNQAWVRVTGDLEIQVREARCDDSSYRYRIETRRPGRGFTGRELTVGQPLPSRIVTAQQFIPVDGKVRRPFAGIMSHLPAHVGGSGSHSGSNRQIKTIRFVVAVKPTDHRIPFEPLPDPAQSTATQDKK